MGNAKTLGARPGNCGWERWWWEEKTKMQKGREEQSRLVLFRKGNQLVEGNTTVYLAGTYRLLPFPCDSIKQQLPPISSNEVLWKVGRWKMEDGSQGRAREHRIPYYLLLHSLV
jgi:hypothetical protein